MANGVVVVAEEPFTSLSPCVPVDGRGLFLPEDPRFLENRVDIAQFYVPPAEVYFAVLSAARRSAVLVCGEHEGVTLWVIPPHFLSYHPMVFEPACPPSVRHTHQLARFLPPCTGINSEKQP